MAEPKRFRLTIPAADVSVLQWMEAQQNVSYSIRQLIRDAIRRNGYTDITCSEVEQLPKRGRPAKEDEEETETPVKAPETVRTPEPAQSAPAKADNRDEDGFVDPSQFF